MSALMCLFIGTAAAAELVPAGLENNQLGFYSDVEEIESPLFGAEPAITVNPASWNNLPGDVVQWGIVVDGDGPIDGLVWLEVDDGTNVPLILFAMDRTIDENLAPLGPGELLAWMEPSGPASFDGWPSEAVDFVITQWSSLPSGPVDNGDQESTYSSILVVLLPGCGPGSCAPRPSTGDGGLEEEEREDTGETEPDPAEGETEESDG